MDKIKAVLTQCLETAGPILLRYFDRIGDAQVITKSSHLDLQTVADTESEKAIVSIIRGAFPDHEIMAEEAGGPAASGADVRWIIDPLDGTCNFRHGYPNCAISIAVAIQGDIQLAGVYNPFRNECFRAEKNGGATCNGKPIRVSPIPTLRDSLLIAGFPYDRHARMDHYIQLFKTFMERSQGVLRTGSAAMDLCQVAAGRVSAYYEESLSEWDWAAGLLIVNEAGGRVTDYHGGGGMLARKQMCASNSLIHDELLAILGPSVA